MSKEQRSVYGSDTSKPDEQAGVEVGGGDKAAAATDRKARKEAEPGGGDPDHAEETPKSKQRRD